MDALYWIAGGLLLMNVFGFLIAGEDKRRALRKRWRIPERRLLLVAALGGSVGLYAGFRTFRHKINHPKFMIGVPLILVAQVALVIVLVLFGEQWLLAFQGFFS